MTSAAPLATPPRPGRPPLRFTTLSVATRTTERTRRRAERGAPLAFMAMTATAMVMAAVRAPQYLYISAAAAIGAMLLTVLAGAEDWLDPPGTRSSLEATDWGLRIVSVDGTTTTVARDQLASGRIGPDGRLVLRRQDGIEWVAELGPEDARAVLERLGLTDAQRTVTVPVGSVWSRTAAMLFPQVGGPPSARRVQAAAMGIVMPMMIGLLGMGAGAAYWEAAHGEGTPSFVAAALIALGSMAALWGFGRLRRRGAATIGADGILLHDLWRDRFLSWSEVVAIAPVGPFGLIEITLRDGHPARLRVAPGGDDLLERLRAGKAGSQAAPEPTPFAALDRGSLALAAWKEQLRGITVGEGYREASLQSDQLAAVAADVRARPEHRVAAAVALSSHGAELDDPARARVRIAIDTCADPQMKVALERAAEGEIAEAELAVAERRARTR